MFSLKKAALTLTSVGALTFATAMPLTAFAATDGTITFTEEKATATVKLVDDKGTEIGTFAGRTYSSLEMLDDRAVALKDAAPTLKGYYLTDVCVDSVCESASMDILYDDFDYVDGPFEVKDGSQIRFVYTPYTPVVVAGSEAKSTLSKTAVDNGDGKTYTQTGTFQIANGTAGGSKKPVDVLFLLDESGSVNFESLETGVLNALDKFSAASNLDVNFGLITLADYGRTVVPLGDNTADDVKAGFAEIKAERQVNGDDLSAGLVQVRHELGRARSGAQKVIVLLGDNGAASGASYHRVIRSEGTQTGSSWLLDLTDYDSYASLYDYNLSQLPLNSGDIMYVGEVDGWSSGDDMKQFSELSAHKSSVVYGKGDEAGFFESFATDMVALEATSIAVTDTLSNNVELVSKDITLTVTDASGKEVASGTNTVTLPATSANKKATLKASVSADGKTITVAFPADYKSEDGWSYSFSEQITLSADAPTGDEALVDKSDPNTGTWAESNGLFTSVRKSSKVTYTTGSGMARTDVFPMPVVLKPVAYDATNDPTPTDTPTTTPTIKPDTEKLAKTGVPVAGGLFGAVLAAIGLHLVRVRRRAMR